MRAGIEYEDENEEDEGRSDGAFWRGLVSFGEFWSSFAGSFRRCQSAMADKSKQLTINNDSTVEP